MDFDHSGAVVNQEDIALEDNSQATSVSMDIDTIVEQPTLLDTSNEEVIVSDFIGDQFGFQEYSMQGENSSGANITIEDNQLCEATITSNEQVIDLQYADCVSKATTSKSNVITIKAVPQQRAAKKAPTPASTFPRQVAIAPKPPKSAPNVQYAIAPKPVALTVNKANVSKTITMKNVVQNIKGSTVLAQIGKQLVMLPAGSTGQKIKLASLLNPSGSADSNNQIQIVRCGNESAQLISNKAGKPIRTKFIVQGQTNSDSSNQPAVITKLMPVGTPSQARYVMQQKTVPISIGGNKVVLTTPPKQSIKVAPKKQIISIKSQSPKGVTTQGNVQTKKVLITANQPQSQNIVIKTAGDKAGAQVVNDNTVKQQRTQLHPINVPGKGIQFIKLVTNQSVATGATVPKAAKPHTISMSGKNFVLTDSKGNIIQMTAEKVTSSQPPPLQLSASTNSNTVTTKPVTKKLVRIAPINKSSAPSAPQPVRASQSLLIDSKPSVLSGTSVSIEEYNEMVDQNNLTSFVSLAGEETIEQAAEEETLVEEEPKEMESANVDVKPTLASLISDAVVEEDVQHHMEEVEIEYENTSHKQERYPEDENTNSMEHDSSNERPDENLIIVPSILPDNNSRIDDEDMYRDDTNTSMDNSKDMSRGVNMESEDIMSYLTPQIDQSYSESVYNVYDGKTEEPALRPRKACNCTKSQCLKLYCDCFANGEFCHQCNCNNCHNNLENEELRQKAIRACLERNPNAFRPKIGKAKSGGPEIIRRHNKGCNCKRSGCLKNYCECYEAKIACTIMCKCVGCRNVEETLERRREAFADPAYRPPLPAAKLSVSRQPCSFMTPEVIEAVAQCMLATVTERDAQENREDHIDRSDHADPVEDILLEFSRCMADIISASHHQL